MERAPIVVAAAVVAVIAAVGVKLLSERTLINTGFEADDRTLTTGAGDTGSRGLGSGDRSAGGAGVSGSRSGAGAVSGARERRQGERSSAARSRASGSTRRDLQPAAVEREGGRRIERRRANAVGPTGNDKSEITDFLGSRSSGGSSQPAGAGDAPPDVALEVLTEEDSSKALYKEGVFEPDDGGEGLKFTEHAQLTFGAAGGANGEAGTITFDVEPDWAGTDATDNSLVQIRAQNQWENRLQLVKNGRYLRFILSDSFGREADISVPIDEWVPGESHSVTASWGDGRTSLFLDGRLAGSNTYDGQFDIAPDTPLYLGSDFRDSDYGGAQATIRGFTVFTTSQHP